MMLIVGDQLVSPAAFWSIPILCIARSSRPITRPTPRKTERFHVLARAIGLANVVAFPHCTPWMAFVPLTRMRSQYEGEERVRCKAGWLSTQSASGRTSRTAGCRGAGSQEILSP